MNTLAAEGTKKINTLAAGGKKKNTLAAIFAAGGKNMLTEGVVGETTTTRCPRRA